MAEIVNVFIYLTSYAITAWNNLLAAHKVS